MCFKELGREPSSHVSDGVGEGWVLYCFFEEVEHRLEESGPLRKAGNSWLRCRYRCVYVTRYWGCYFSIFMIKFHLCVISIHVTFNFLLSSSFLFLLQL